MPNHLNCLFLFGPLAARKDSRHEREKTMAGEAEKETLIESQAVLPEDLPTSEDEDSLGAIVAKVQHPVFSGHPAMGGEEEDKADLEDEGTRKAEDEGEDKPKTPPDEAIPEGWEFKPKYKDHQSAEKGAKEHQALATKATQETAREREAREAAELETLGLRQKLAEKEAAAAPEKPVTPEKTPEELEADQEAKIEQALNEIDLLDEFAPDYKKKLAKAWRKAGIGGSGQPAIPDGKVLDEIIDKRVEERLQVKEAEKAAATKVVEEKSTRTRAGELAGKSGLNMEEGTADNKLFWATVNDMPKEFDDKPFEEQVQWTVNEVRRLKGEVVQSKAEMEARARKVQTDNAVLGRGGERPKKPAAPEPYTLGSIMNKHQAGRRI